MELINQLREVYPVFQIVLSLVSLLLFFLIAKIFYRLARARASLYNFDKTRVYYIRRALRTTVILLYLFVLAIIWEVSLRGLGLYIASFTTVIGVGLFANWSIVSNITASVILFFFFPFKIGSRVRVLDGDNSVEGVVINISLFSIQIKREDGRDAYVPNNVAIQKSIIHLGDG